MSRHEPHQNTRRRTPPNQRGNSTPSLASVTTFSDSIAPSFADGPGVPQINAAVARLWLSGNPTDVAPDACTAEPDQLALESQPDSWGRIINFGLRDGHARLIDPTMAAGDAADPMYDQYTLDRDVDQVSKSWDDSVFAECIAGDICTQNSALSHEARRAAERQTVTLLRLGRLLRPFTVELSRRHRHGAGGERARSTWAGQVRVKSDYGLFLGPAAAIQATKTSSQFDMTRLEGAGSKMVPWNNGSAELTELLLEKLLNTNEEDQWYGEPPLKPDLKDPGLGINTVDRNTCVDFHFGNDNTPLLRLRDVCIPLPARLLESMLFDQGRNQGYLVVRTTLDLTGLSSAVVDHLGRLAFKTSDDALY